MGVYALCGEHHYQTIEVVLTFTNSEFVTRYQIGTKQPGHGSAG
jgi:hypothetical protein